MRLNELAGKEIVNLYDGSRLGVVGESDVVIDTETGQIQAIILPRRGGPIGFWLDRQQLVIPWEAVRKIGAEFIIVDLEQAHAVPRRF
ncbi:YlmC/YmxH family sporulation protein [Desulfovirgula thermocuniculi]|uniref:YlmC/YmxH family sporulation protein n=1 Tax=Desulfovirgula thermocuniculi TaxID=348842 RepID=UPI000421B439|nr:YlmC/YmxH family sporulation protein [Desulfovirgula thermocuniculi]